MTRLSKLAAAAALSAGALVLSAGAASARIVCDEDGDCWHVTDNTYVYPPEARVVIHEDDWRWGDRDRFRWREHDGRGYWRSGIWVTF